MKREHIVQIEGYQETLAEVAATGKYGTDYLEESGQVAAMIKRLHPKRLALRVNQIIEESPSTRTFRLTSRSGWLPPFLAGQYLTVFAEIGPLRTARPYSISSPPNQRGFYDITVRRVEKGLVSNWLLDQVEKGQTLITSGPNGYFYHNPLVHASSTVCIAGGSGITPFMSMIREVVECGLEREIALVYGNRASSDMPFHPALVELARTHAAITYLPVVEAPDAHWEGKTGLIDAGIITSAAGRLDDKCFFVCGPKGLYDHCLPILEQLSIPRRRIKREMYGPPLDVTRQSDWPSTIEAETLFRVTIGSKTITARADAPLIRSLEQSGLVVPSLCRSGECSMCRIKVLQGKVFQPEGVAQRASDRQFGYIHACVAYPLSNLEIDIFR